MRDIDRAIAQVLESYRLAVYEKSVAALMQLYDPDVRVFDMWGVWSYEGAEAWRSAVDGWFTSLGTERVVVTFDDVSSIGEGECAAVSAIVTYTGVSADGEELRAMQNRLSWVLRTSGGVLGIVHEHTSAPVGFADMKAILQRGGGA
ncbi:MAG TPA: nuclear transport factor 2 family protein [Candidatus Kapabacteria bacterium]|nr:nuclear transport factor 2 family protein [Candidatus Kapabacteria bacterium]